MSYTLRYSILVNGYREDSSTKAEALRLARRWARESVGSIVCVFKTERINGRLHVSHVCTIKKPNGQPLEVWDERE